MQMRSKLCRRWGWGVWLALPQAVQAQQLVGLAQMHAADTAWVLVSATLVLLMTLPGVALFYAGMVRRKNVLNTLAAVLGTACVVSVVWFAVGYSLALTPGTRWLVAPSCHLPKQKAPGVPALWKGISLVDAL